MKTTKNKTNEDILKQLVKELNMFEMALMRERIMCIMEATEVWAKKELEDPNHKLQIVDPQLYINLSTKVKKILSFNE
jgi:hypothetical protein